MNTVPVLPPNTGKSGIFAYAKWMFNQDCTDGGGDRVCFHMFTSWGAKLIKTDIRKENLPFIINRTNHCNIMDFVRAVATQTICIV